MDPPEQKEPNPSKDQPLSQNAAKSKAKHHKEIQIKTLDEAKLKELSEAVSANIEVLTFRLENKGIFDAQGIYFNSALRLFSKKGAKKLRIFLTNNPITHNTVEEICKNISAYLPSLVHVVFQLDQTLVNDQAINYIFEMLRHVGEYLKVFEISLTGSQVTDIGMSDLFQALKFLPLECDVYVGNEDSETLQSLAKEFSSYQKFQRMLQRGEASQSESDDEEEDSDDEEGMIKIRNLDDEDSENEGEAVTKKKKKKKETKKKQKKKQGLLKTTKQKNQFNQFQITPQMLAGINPIMLQQMYAQMMQSGMPMNKMMNPYMWQQQQQQFNNPMLQKQMQNNLAMQNMMMMKQQQQQQQQGQQQKFPMGFNPQQQQQFQQQQLQMMQQQTQAFQQLQKNIKEMQSKSTGEQSQQQQQSKNQGDQKTDKQENKKVGQEAQPQQPQQQQFLQQMMQQQQFQQQQQQQAMAFAQLQKQIKDQQQQQQKNGEDKKNETEETIPVDLKKETKIPIGFPQPAMQQQMSAFAELQRNLKEIQKNQSTGEQKTNKEQENPKQQDQDLKPNIQQQMQPPMPMPRIPIPQQQQQQQFQQQSQPKQQVNDFELILEKLRAQQAALLQQQQQEKNNEGLNENIPQIGKPVQAIPPGFKQKNSPIQQKSEEESQKQSSQFLQSSIESYFANLNLQQQPQSNQQQGQQQQQNENIFKIFQS